MNHPLRADLGCYSSLKYRYRIRTDNIVSSQPYSVVLCLDAANILCLRYLKRFSGSFMQLCQRQSTFSTQNMLHQCARTDKRKDALPLKARGDCTLTWGHFSPWCAWSARITKVVCGRTQIYPELCSGSRSAVSFITTIKIIEDRSI